MTPHERAREIVGGWYPKADISHGYITEDSLDAIIAAIAAALEEEIEACAKVADEMLIEVAGGDRVGRAIRQRKGAR